MKHSLISFVLLVSFAALPALGSVCPSTAATTSDCDFLITIGATGTATVSTVTGSTPFNAPITFTDGTTDPGADASLIGVINDYSQSLTSFTLTGSGTGAGIFDFTSNGICVYTGASYCGAAPSGYEGPTSTFSNLQSTVPFQTNVGTVDFNPGLAPSYWTYFSLQGSASDINANGGLAVSGLTFGPTSATPEPGPALLFGLGLATLLLAGVKLRARPH